MDGENLVTLIPRILKAIEFSFSELQSNILIVNDDWISDPSLLIDKLVTPKHSLEVIELGKNVGNQSAIIAGLSRIIGKCADEDLIIVMDSDGEDLPEDIPTLVNSLKSSGMPLVVATRGHRRARWTFILGLTFFSVFFRILTGSRWNSGNFSCFKGRWLKGYFEDLECSGNFAGFVRYKAESHGTLNLDRGERITGQTRTSFISLVNHALDCLMVWHLEIRIRALLFFAGNLTFFLATLMAALLFRLGPYETSPNWITLIFYGSATMTLLSLSLFLSSLILSVSERKSYLKYTTLRKKLRGDPDGT